MARAYYSDDLGTFITKDAESILGVLVASNSFSLEATQRDAWIYQIDCLQKILSSHEGRGRIYFEFSVPRLGKRIDVVLIIDSVLFVLEFKVGESNFTTYAHDQVWDYALDLKNFHGNPSVL